MRGGGPWTSRSAPGRNIPWYDESVDLVGIDLSPRMLGVARRRADGLGHPVELREGAAEELPFPDASFDTVVCTLAVCAVSDRAAAIAEMHRVLRPGGLLLLLDHLEHIRLSHLGGARRRCGVRLSPRPRTNPALSSAREPCPRPW